MQEYLKSLTENYSTSQLLLNRNQTRTLEQMFWVDDGYELMQYASTECYKAIVDRIDTKSVIHIYVGSGNNGGDGFEIGANLLRDDYDVIAIEVVPQKQGICASKAKERFLSQGGKIVSLSTAFELPDPDVIIDAILGIGCSSKGSNNSDSFLTIKKAISHINSLESVVFSVDVPSLLDIDNGLPIGDEAVISDYTLSIFTNKIGLFVGLAKNYTGEIIIVANGLDNFAECVKKSVEIKEQPRNIHVKYSEIVDLLPYRCPCAHKGDNGKLLLIGGNTGMTGALVLASLASIKTGIGLTCALSLAEDNFMMTAINPCVMTATKKQFTDRLKWTDAIVIGPGFGRNKEDFTFIEQTILANKPIVIDADAIWHLKQNSYTFDARQQAVLTPHIGEAAMLCGVSIEKIYEDPLYYAKTIAQTHGAICVLKSATTIVTDGTDCNYVYSGGNECMGTGGMGDLLTGIIGTLLAQGYPSLLAAIIGVVIHGESGRIEAKFNGKIGACAVDLLPHIRALINYDD